MTATIGYRLRYVVAAIGLRLPGRLGWWVLTRRMFEPEDNGSEAQP